MINSLKAHLVNDQLLGFQSPKPLAYLALDLPKRGWDGICEGASRCR